MCNVYLNQIDRVWSVREHGVLVRFADDVVVMCATREQAEAALARLRRLLADLGLEPKEAKTRIVHMTEGGPGLDLLGFHHRLVRSRGIRGGRGYPFVARWPSDKAMQHARDRIRQLTQRSRLLLPVEAVVEDLNRFLRGWAGFFRYGHSTQRLGKIRHYALERLAIVIRKRHRGSRGYGWNVVSRLSPNQCGLDQPPWNCRRAQDRGICTPVRTVAMPASARTVSSSEGTCRRGPERCTGTGSRHLRGPWRGCGRPG
jgi:RNA-directed DNA polymerase